MREHEFPASLVNDKTPMEKQCTCVHKAFDERYLFIALRNGNLQLCIDGTWKWTERD